MELLLQFVTSALSGGQGQLSTAQELSSSTPQMLLNNEKWRLELHYECE